MSEPRFGNCRDCAAWRDPFDGQSPDYIRVCRRHPKQLVSAANDGCFDHIPAPEEDRNG